MSAFIVSARMAVVAPVAVLLAAPLTQAADFPTNAELNYVGPYGVPATMTFNRSGNGYKVVARINVPMYQMRFESSGSVVGNRLKPTQYRDIRRGKVYAQATFSGSQVRYGKVGEAVQTSSVKGPTFDLFTLAWQLAMNDGRLPASLQITNGKKLYPVAGIRKIDSGPFRIGGGDITVNRYRVQRGGDTIDYAFAPEWHNIPAQITYVDDGKTYMLKLKSIKLNGKAVQPK